MEVVVLGVVAALAVAAVVLFLRNKGRSVSGGSGVRTDPTDTEVK